MVDVHTCSIEQAVFYAEMAGNAEMKADTWYLLYLNTVTRFF